MTEYPLLITGFDPFGGAQINPAWEAVKALPEKIGPFRLYKLEIPTVFGLAGQRVLQAAQVIGPKVILCVGQAGGRGAITPERIAINVRDARIPDNQGNQPLGERIDPDGPAAYFSTLDVKAMAQAIEAAGFPAAVSNSAGAFVCNDTLYTLLRHFDRSDTRVGFVHVPWLPEQGTPCLPLADTVSGLTAAIGAISPE